MLSTIKNRALVRRMLAGAVVLGVVSACSRPDRADAGPDTTQTGTAVTSADTQVSNAPRPAVSDTTAPRPAPQTETAVTPPATEPAPAAAEPKDSAITTGDQGVSGYQAMGHNAPQTDTASAANPPAAETAQAPADTDAVAVGDSAQVGKPGKRLEPTETTSQANADTLGNAEGERVRPPEDSSETLGQVTADSAEMAAADPMARDTSAALAQGDTAQVRSDVAIQAEADSGAVQVQVDTAAEAQTELAVQDQADTITVVGDSGSVDKPGPRAQEDTVSLKADSISQHHAADRVRPPEDSTEVYGEVTTEAELEAVGDANDQGVGAAQVPSTGNVATGADAVALMTRAGQPCRIQSSRDANWDLASSPATLNPCGSGTMTLPKVQTGEK